MLIYHQYIFFGELLKSLTHLLIRLLVFLLSFKNYFYILDNSPLSKVSFANIFFQSVSYHLIHWTMSFAEQNFLIVMNSNL